MQVSKILGEKLTLGSFLAFVANLYHSQKLLEFFSFILWEAKYRLMLYEEQQVLQFSEVKSPGHIEDGLSLEGIAPAHFTISPCQLNWILIFIDKSGTHWGTVLGDEATLRTYSGEGELMHTHDFPDTIECIHADSKGNLFCCARGRLYKSTDSGLTFRQVLAFSTPESFFRNDTVAELPSGDILMGEYANVKKGKRWKFVGYIYHSKDQGETWETLDFLERQKVNKHVHILQWSEVLGGLVLTDGDNQKNVWINRSNASFNSICGSGEQGWKRINRYHLDKGGYTGFVEVDGKMFFGTDYNGGTNFIITTSNMRSFREEVIPDPYRRAMFNRITLRQDSRKRPEIWASLHFKNSRKVKSLLMVSTDQGQSWQKVIEYDGTRYELKIVSSSSEPSRELFFLIKNRRSNTIRSYRVHD